MGQRMAMQLVQLSNAPPQAGDEDLSLGASLRSQGRRQPGLMRRGSHITMAVPLDSQPDGGGGRQSFDSLGGKGEEGEGGRH
jgi:hypothetical protein